MLQVIRQFSIRLNESLVAMWPERYHPEWLDYAVLAVEQEPADEENETVTRFLIVNRLGEFEWIASENCKIGKIYDREA